MPIGFGFPRALLNRVRRFAVWIGLEINGFVDRVGEDVANETIDMIGIGYKQCENPDCRKNTNDWHKCATNGIILCAECGSFDQCQLCLKWYCCDCSDLEILACCELEICHNCRTTHDGVDLYWLNCCQEYVCCGREIWHDNEVDQYSCGAHLTMVQCYTDENIETRLREQHREELMTLRQTERSPTPPDFEYDTDVESD